MSTNHTPNYNLSQWVRTDKVQMDDFNADNAKLDAALAAHDAALALRGNCRVQTFTVYDDADASTTLNIPFSARPVAFLMFANSFLAVCSGSSNVSFAAYNIPSGAYLSTLSYTWNGNTAVAYHAASSPTTYTVVAFYAEDR